MEWLRRPAGRPLTSQTLISSPRVVHFRPRAPARAPSPPTPRPGRLVSAPRGRRLARSAGEAGPEIWCSIKLCKDSWRSGMASQPDANLKNSSLPLCSLELPAAQLIATSVCSPAAHCNDNNRGGNSNSNNNNNNEDQTGLNNNNDNKAPTGLSSQPSIGWACPSGQSAGLWAFVPLGSVASSLSGSGSGFGPGSNRLSRRSLTRSPPTTDQTLWARQLADGKNATESPFWPRRLGHKAAGGGPSGALAKRPPPSARSPDWGASGSAPSTRPLNGRRRRSPSLACGPSHSFGLRQVSRATQLAAGGGEDATSADGLARPQDERRAPPRGDGPSPPTIFARRSGREAASRESPPTATVCAGARYKIGKHSRARRLIHTGHLSMLLAGEQCPLTPLNGSIQPSRFRAGGLGRSLPRAAPIAARGSLQWPPSA